ncbi:hypothetical protein [Herbaspirillum sp. RV1423]|uniref:hypothetical protein n=1 Tax=Herbaspirillum sp. RV1423 TaxID=1443993 RepID=UPI0012DDBD7D|nr:hypothetical protein [Herbaspirillum sp. RV1423]
MKRFIEGLDRHQRILLPEQLDDYVAESNPVRVFHPETMLVPAIAWNQLVMPVS